LSQWYLSRGRDFATFLKLQFAPDITRDAKEIVGTLAFVALLLIQTGARRLLEEGHALSRQVQREVRSLSYTPSQPTRPRQRVEPRGLKLVQKKIIVTP
jgi:hypothetical protein